MPTTKRRSKTYPDGVHTKEQRASFRKEVLQHAHDHGNAATRDKYGISLQQIYTWKWEANKNRTNGHAAITGRKTKRRKTTATKATPVVKISTGVHPVSTTETEYQKAFKALETTHKKLRKQFNHQRRQLMQLRRYVSTIHETKPKSFKG